MLEQILAVKYIPAKNCFLHLPAKLYKQYFVQGTCISVKYEHMIFYLTCDPKPLRQTYNDSYDENICGLNSLFAQSMGLNEGDVVTCSLVSHSGSLKSIHIIPLTNDDWDLLETNANKVQTTFMDQVRVVCDKQILTLWCSQTLCIKFQVVNLEPNIRMGYLENDSQVIVVHPDEKDTFRKPTDTSWTITQFIKDQFFKKPEETVETDEDEKILRELEILFKKFNRNKYDVYRTIPIKSIHGYDENLDKDLFILIDKDDFPQNHKPSNVYEIKKVSACQKYLKKDETINNTKFYIKLSTIDNLSSTDNKNKDYLINFFTNCSNGSLVISHCLCEILNLNLGDRVVLENVKEIKELESIELNFGMKNQNLDVSDLIDLFKQYILNKGSEYKVLIPNKVKLKLHNENSEYIVQVNLKPDDLMYAEMNTDFFSRVSIKTIFENFDGYGDEYKFDEYDFGTEKFCTDLHGFSHIVEGCVRNIERDFKKFLVPQNMLIEGSEGTGKTSITKAICQKLAKAPYYYHVRIIQCKALKGRRCESVLNEIGNALYDTIQRSPSVIVFDDLDQILKYIEPEKDAPDVILMTNRLADMFYNMISLCQKHHMTCIIGTCKTTRMLNSHIYCARGRHLFSEVYKVPDLDKENRIKLMKHLLKQGAYLEPNLDWPTYSEMSEGYVMQDFVDFAQRAIFHAWKIKSKSNNKALSHVLTANHECITKALADTRPLSITSDNGSLKSSDAGDTWNAVGGLADVKEQLLELVKWPSLYPKVFMNAPITLSRGVLLYGPPGCGKTLLGTILAKYCKLRLIRVRGPELLGKYAGESERQVREVFKRAQSARPCILFFDEFDSLAPRRGHDTSGVSDRVVNQLLTELDGCESRDVTGGVFILAATSRPDLIDPALLRPGRLDPQFHCPIPDSSRRLDILKSLTLFNTKLHLMGDDEENEGILKDIANGSDGFTGADLNALLCKAKELAIDNQQENISRDNLIEALETTRPSLSAKERQKYETIYRRFTNSSIPENGTTVMAKRATLA